MLEIIALIFLVRHIGRIAIQKGESVLKWRMYAVLAWIGMELVGGLVALMFFSPQNLVSILIVAIGFAITGYYLVLKKLQELPDVE